MQAPITWSSGCPAKTVGFLYGVFMVTNAPSIAEKSCHMVLQIYYHKLSPLRRTEVTFRTATTSGYLLARIQQAYGASIK